MHICALLLAFQCAFASNLLLNPSFEYDRDNDGSADGWFQEVHQREGGEGYFELDAIVKLHGRFAQKIIHTSERGWVRQSQMPLPAQPNSVYMFKCWVKSTCRFVIIVYEFYGDGEQYLSHQIASGIASDWQLVAKSFRTRPDARYFKVSLVTDSRGEAWFDDAVLTAVKWTPELLIPYTAQPPLINGELDDACWRNAAYAAPFYILGGNGELAQPSTTAMICYDDENIYIAFQCDEPSPKRLKITHDKYDSPVWMDDCVEVYFDPAHTHRNWYHIIVNARGVRADEALVSKRWHRVWWRAGDIGARRLNWNPKWRAAAKVSNRRWIVELAIPFDAFGEAGSYRKAWGINFCRSRKVEGEQNSCWAYIAGESFQVPEAFGHAIFERRYVKSQTQPIKAPLPRATSTPLVIPQPQRMHCESGKFKLTNNCVIVIRPDASYGEQFVAEQLMKDIRERFGVELTIIATEAPPKGKRWIAIAKVDGHPPDNPVIDAQLWMALGDERTNPEAYILRTTPNAVAIFGVSARGAFYGAQTLRQMIQLDDNNAVIPCATIIDYPQMKWRGWHMRSPLRKELRFYRRLIDFMALLKMNTLMLEVNNSLQYERHVDIASKDAPTKAELRQLVNYARERFIEVIPQVQTFGHFNYVLNNPKYRHLAELTQPHKRFGFWTYCPSNPDVYSLVFDMFEEVIEAFQPRYFHIGHDEITFVPMGICSRCKGRPPHELLAHDIIKLHNFLKRKGLTMLMWGDQLLPTHNGGAPYYTALATDIIPKDIIICDWHYSPWKDYPSLIYFAQHGFRAIACGWFHAENVYNFSQRAFQYGALGYCGTTWYHPLNIPHQSDLMSAMVIAGENSWSVARPQLPQFAYHPTRAFQSLWEIAGMECSYRWREFVVINLSEYANVNRAGIAQSDDGRSVWLQCDFTLLPKGLVWLDGIPFYLPVNENRSLVAVTNARMMKDVLPATVWQIPIGVKARSLFFLHTTTPRAKVVEHIYQRRREDPNKVGEYVVTYEDGTQEIIELIYRRHITEWNDRLGCSDARIVWRGRTQDGALIHLCAYEWQNPHPTKCIRTIDFKTAFSSVSPMLIAITAGR